MNLRERCIAYKTEIRRDDLHKIKKAMRIELVEKSIWNMCHRIEQGKEAVNLFCEASQLFEFVLHPQPLPELKHMQKAGIWGYLSLIRHECVREHIVESNLERVISKLLWIATLESTKIRNLALQRLHELLQLARDSKEDCFQGLIGLEFVSLFRDCPLLTGDLCGIAMLGIHYMEIHWLVGLVNTEGFFTHCLSEQSLQICREILRRLRREGMDDLAEICESMIVGTVNNRS